MSRRTWFRITGQGRTVHLPIADAPDLLEAFDAYIGADRYHSSADEEDTMLEAAQEYFPHGEPENVELIAEEDVDPRGK